MGAGQGKTRRAQAQLTAFQASQVKNGQAVFVLKPWKEFVKDSGVGTVKMHNYYLGKNTQAGERVDYEKLLTEMLADAVSAGAILLPEPYVAEDFQYKAVQQGTRPPNKAEVSLKKEPQFKGEVSYLSYYMGKNGTMS